MFISKRQYAESISYYINHSSLYIFFYYCFSCTKGHRRAWCLYQLSLDESGLTPWTSRHFMAVPYGKTNYPSG